MLAFRPKQVLPPPSYLHPLRPRTSPTQLPLLTHHFFSISPHPLFIKRVSHLLRGSLCLCSGSEFLAASSSAAEDESDVELGRLLALLPEEMRRRVSEHPELHRLIEVVMDLGRKPLARFPSGDFVLSDHPITFQDLEHATSQVGDFSIDNRAGISRTLHRISAIRNRKGRIIGLTCRVGRAISGSADLLRDLVKDGASLLLIGPPGVGKTTIIREIARMLANDYKKRVMIVDTSNEIGGDGDIPHAGIGNARRMQVPNSDMQHKSVTLGDEEASRRGVQKTVLERKGPSTFTSGVEIISKAELRVHRNLEATVDAILSGRSPNYEVRRISSEGVGHDVLTEVMEPLTDISVQEQNESVVDDIPEINDKMDGHNEFTNEPPTVLVENPHNDEAPLFLYVYGILETSVIQAVKQLRVDGEVELTDNISEADALLALQSKLKKNSRIQAVAKSHEIPIYVTKTSSLLQIVKAIRAFTREYAERAKDSKSEKRMSSLEKIDALEEVRLAIEQVVIPKGEPVELLPRSSHIMSLQMDLIQKYQLQSQKVGEEPNLRLRILPFQTKMDVVRHGEMDETGDWFDDFGGTDGEMNGSSYNVDRLPLLPE
ncbi:PREDICTED: uncharacterized protein ycf45 isoform X2 [Nelumbo nucifera]|uniref:Uncharacterized protein ycf45 isoform X2 n=1 Tax=Nelumbo nucifera TaxID=4432 RepID=A0A1U8BNX1_NELNU|nr:PREDICTED: uncharacterized protein ycf45 isoform X2 [Nelumbo nucifera]